MGLAPLKPEGGPLKPEGGVYTMDPGLRPVEFNVLVKPQKVEQGIEIKRNDGTFTTLWKPDASRDMEQAAAIEGKIIAISPVAFTYERWPDDAQKPKVGDRVHFAKWAGMKVKGKDGEDYLYLKDKDIAGVIA